MSSAPFFSASGGFDGQDWSKELYAPGAVGWHTFSSPGNTGDGIELAKEADALHDEIVACIQARPLTGRIGFPIPAPIAGIGLAQHLLGNHPGALLKPAPTGIELIQVHHTPARPIGEGGAGPRLACTRGCRKAFGR